MSFYWIKTNTIIKRYFSNYVWDIPNKENRIYLTFDDGPTPEITEWVLELLKRENIKATFFCIGKNIEAHPHLFNALIKDGHTIGNHTMNHLNGWKNSDENYLDNTQRCEMIIEKFHNQKPSLFRPPYGRIKRKQAMQLQKKGYKIIMWDVLSADFDIQITPEKCLKNVISSVRSGSIIVFHDSEKAFKNLKYTLPKAIQYLKQNGFIFETLS
jgi:peptidoglycan-N-acetylglucosamine deacetylase